MRRRSLKHSTASLLVGLALVLGVTVASSLLLDTGSVEAATSPDALDIFMSEVEYTYAKGVVEIDLTDPADNEDSRVLVEDGIVKITAAGVYSLSGTMTYGRVEVDTKGKVYLQLNGVDVTSSSGPALSVTDAQKVTIILAAGSNNSLAAAANSPAALRSDDSLVFTGSGTLTVTGGSGGGISSDDDIVVNNGVIRVVAAGDGLAANDDITINGGDVSIIAGQDGLESDGTIHINGGTLVAFGGTDLGEGGIDARGEVVVTGGTVVAGGNKMIPISDDSRQMSVFITSAAIQSDGAVVRLQRDGRDVFNFTPEVAYQNVLISSSALTKGIDYQAFLGDKAGNVVVASR